MKMKLEKECPICLHVCYAVSGVDDADVPVAGDLIVCGHCKAILTFEEDFSFREATADEIAECHFPDLQQAHELIDMNKAN